MSEHLTQIPSTMLEAELDTLFSVSQILSRSLDLPETLREVLQVIGEGCGLGLGLVALLSDENGNELFISAAHGLDMEAASRIRYLRGEGVLGLVLERGRSVILDEVRREKRFLDRLGAYSPDKPFIAVPIRIGSELVGVLASQPDTCEDGLLDERAHFQEMVANLIGQSVRLARQVAKEKRDILDERDDLRRTVRGQYGFSSIVGRSEPMKHVFDQLRQVAKWNTTVLIRGETGTGKELIASAIHYNSPRSASPFVKLNCAALPENLLESELFGHEKGAFTGAVSQRKGRFEQADGGTLFLDEIGEVSPAFQAKLLRILQEGELERVGGSRTLKVDVRVIAATHRDLELAVEEGKFREDLYYRLNVMPIYVPALRDRIEDIPDIARFLVGKIAKLQGRELGITDSALRLLSQHHWPGNVRELENCLERAAVMCDNSSIDRDLVLMCGIEERLQAPRPKLRPVSIPAPMDLQDENMDEREKVIAALEQAGWVQAKAARLLGMTPRQIAYRIQTLNITVRQI
ncbi:MAG: nif-specific transcriptional activator NifA [Zoogloea sp.]|uniref:nif-specific transcriptional activator NifA n=1 Tax=Zoogloea sp. TaxID=49181 RepID=UPI003F38CB2F